MKTVKGSTANYAIKPLVMALALGFSGLALAADEAKTVSELQAENTRLRQELEALRVQQGAAPASTATAPAAAPVAAAPVAAATAPAVREDTLGSVIVTSRNREEIAQDIPLPVQVIGGEQLERDNVKSVWDLAGKAPNLQLNPPGENARKVSVSIRGVGRNGANDSAEGSVSTIVDGVSLYYAGQAWNDYVDVDRIEVLRGPQGTLLGKNTTLGAINIVTRPPSFTPSTSFQATTGTNNDLSGRFSTTGPIADGLLAYRASFVADRADGFYTNTYQSFGNAKETWNETNKLAGRLQLLVTPTADITDRIIIDKSRSDERTNVGFQNDNGPATWADGRARATVTVPTAFTAQAAGLPTYGYLGKFVERAAWFHNADGSIYQPRLGSRDFGNSEARPQITNQWGLSNELNWNVANHTFTSITATRYQDFDIKNGGNYDQFYISNSGQQLFNTQFSQEFRVASTPAADKKLDYQAGLYFLDARVYSDDPSYYGPDAGAWNATTASTGAVIGNNNRTYDRLIGTAAGRELLRASLEGLYQSSVTDARVKSLALYGQTDWHVTDLTTATAGVRVTGEQKSNRISQELDRGGIALTAANFPTATLDELAAANRIRSQTIKTPYGFIEGTPIDAQLLAWNLGASHKLNEDTLLYTSAGVGVKSGIVTWASTSLSGGTLTPANLESEKSFDLELGFKSLLLEKKLLLNVNAYQTRVTNYQTQVNVADASSTTGFSNIWTNAPGVVSRGIELEAAYQATKGLQFTATGALNKATYDGQFLVAKPDVDAANYVGIDKFSDLNGKQLSNAPDTTLNLGVNYQAPVGAYLGRVTLSNAFRSGTYLASNQSENSWQGGYSILNLGLGLGSFNKKWEVSLNATNLLDKVYASSKSSYSATGASGLQIGAPRYIGLTLKSNL
jgi:iron complex outermembrane receptor protein